MDGVTGQLFKTTLPSGKIRPPESYLEGPSFSLCSGQPKMRGLVIPPYTMAGAQVMLEGGLTDNKSIAGQVYP